jgi:hypothetical protein
LNAKEENKNIKFGCYIYEDSLKYKDILRITLECEKLGYDSVWLKDNFIPWVQDYISFNSNTDNNNTNNSSHFHRQEKQHRPRSIIYFLTCKVMLDNQRFIPFVIQCVPHR